MLRAVDDGGGIGFAQREVERAESPIAGEAGGEPGVAVLDRLEAMKLGLRQRVTDAAGELADVGADVEDGADRVRRQIAVLEAVLHRSAVVGAEGGLDLVEPHAVLVPLERPENTTNETNGKLGKSE